MCQTLKQPCERLVVGLYPARTGYLAIACSSLCNDYEWHVLQDIWDAADAQSLSFHHRGRDNGKRGRSLLSIQR